MDEYCEDIKHGGYLMENNLNTTINTDVCVDHVKIEKCDEVDVTDSFIKHTHVKSEFVASDLGLIDNDGREDVKFGIVHDELLIKNENFDDDEKSEHYKCKLCSWHTSDESSLREHFMLVHALFIKIQRLHKKNEFSNILVQKADSYFKIHMLKHQNYGPFFYCPQCDYTAEKKCNLLNHMLIHKINAPTFNCSQCDHKTKRKNCLKKHMLIHQNNVPIFKCSECDFKAKRKYNLKNHMVIHQNNAPTFNCLQCDYKTKRRNDLKKHMVIHQNNAPTFDCSECNFKTKLKGNLKRHKFIHQNNAPSFDCSQCGYKTKRKNDLKKHILIHQTNAFDG